MTPPLDSSGARQSAGEIPQVNQFSYPDVELRVARSQDCAAASRRRSRSQQQRAGTTQIYQNVATLRASRGGIRCNAIRHALPGGKFREMNEFRCSAEPSRGPIRPAIHTVTAGGHFGGRSELKQMNFFTSPDGAC